MPSELGYATVELEAPGDHPNAGKLKQIAKPEAFFAGLRDVILGEPVRADPDELPADYVPAPLPLPAHRDRPGRRRS